MYRGVIRRDPPPPPYIEPGPVENSNQPPKKNEGKPSDFLYVILFVGMGIGVGYLVWGHNQAGFSQAGFLRQANIFKCENDGYQSMIFPAKKVNFYVAMQFCQKFKQEEIGAWPLTYATSHEREYLLRSSNKVSLNY